jgi:glycosyltransferase involved in cell wall biosynthesis
LRSRPEILYAGTYERTYPRNQQLIRLFRRLGIDVVEQHVPFWERFRDKSRGFGGVTAVVPLAVRLIIAYITLIPRTLSRLRRCEALVIGYIGQIDMLVLGSLARLLRKPVIFNPLVTLTDTVVEDRSLVRPGGLAAKLVQVIDWISLRIATVTIVDTEQNAEYLIDRFGVKRSQVEVLYVGADEGIFRRTQRNHTGEHLHVLFYGKMIPLHGVETILQTISTLHEAGECDISFEIIGSGQQEHSVRQYIAEHPDLPVAYRSWVAYQRLPQRIAYADVVLGIFGTGTKAARVVPNKVFQAMAVGAPIVTRRSPAIETILQNDVSALLVEPGDPGDLASAILKLRDSELRSTLANGAHSSFVRYGSDEAGVATVQSIAERHFPDFVLDAEQGRCS